MSLQNGPSPRQERSTPRPARLGLWGLVLLTTSLVTVVYAGHAGFRNQSVGGISIDVSGVVGPPSAEGTKLMLAELKKEVKDAADDMAAPVKLRMVSLRGLAEAAEDALKNNFGRLPDDVQFLAGLQRLQYVFVDVEKNDIILAGPGEGWRIDDKANVVGITTGRPVLRLDDLLVALRAVHAARTEGITCSIDPTPEGVVNLRKLLDAQRGRPLQPQLIEGAMKEAFGAQQVSVTGVPPTSHFARVLVAADYRMKRIAMHLDESPVKKLPSYLELLKNGGARSATNVNPRWWLACNYEPLAATEDGLAWEIRGPGVKAMTEDEFTTPEGEQVGTGRVSKQAQQWADLMTNEYDALSSEDVVFGDLRNLMDMCLVAALIEKNNLWETAQLQVPLLTDPNSDLKIQVWNAAKTIPPQVSFLRARNAWIVTASGGVSIESWQAASKVEPTATLAAVRTQATQRTRSGIWWQ